MVHDQKKNRNQINVLVTGKMNTTNPTFFPSFDSIGKGKIDNSMDFKKNNRASIVNSSSEETKSRDLSN